MEEGLEDALKKEKARSSDLDKLRSKVRVWGEGGRQEFVLWLPATSRVGGDVAVIA